MADKSESEMIAAVASGARESLRQWENLPALIKAGRLVKETGGWYRIVDSKVCDEIGELLDGIEFKGPNGTVSRVKLGRPDPELAQQLEALARRQQ